jgi:hypothetical protein
LKVGETQQAGCVRFERYVELVVRISRQFRARRILRGAGYRQH